MKWRSLFLACGGFLLISGNSIRIASAQDVYVAGSNNQLGILNVSTDVYTPIGVTSQLFYGIAFAPDGTLYGLEASATPSLYTINTTTAATTLVGSTGITNTGYGLAFATNGTLYAMDGTSGLFSLSPTNGAATLIGPIGNSSIGTVEFGANGVLYETDTSTDGSSGSDTLDSLDLTTGAGTPIGLIGFSNVYGLAAANGQFYGFDASNNIFSIDVTTGAGTMVGTYMLPGGGFVEDGTVPISQRSVPEPGIYTLLGSLGLAGAAFLRRRRIRCDA
jgi:hypothetical protein